MNRSNISEVEAEQSVEVSLEWLHDMAEFYEQLQSFVSELPANTRAEDMGSPPDHVASNPRYQTLCRVSRECRYMSRIPSSDGVCLEAIETVQEMSRLAFLSVNAHPAFGTFRVQGRVEPFFERAMILGSCLAVEHQDMIRGAFRASSHNNSSARASTSSSSTAAGVASEA